jgi:hypothetical protein
LVVTMTWSTMPLSLLRRLVDTSFFEKRCATPGCSSASGEVYAPTRPLLSPPCRAIPSNLCHFFKPPALKAPAWW